MQVTIIGSGYVGLVSGTCFADFGHEVVCVDKDSAKIEALNAGKIPIYEPGLDDLVATNVAAGRLSFTTELADSVPSDAAVFLSVGTPSPHGAGHTDRTFVHQAAGAIAHSHSRNTKIASKSTIHLPTSDTNESTH